jgi:hypothetical protein
MRGNYLAISSVLVDSSMTFYKKRGKLFTNQSEVKYIGSSYYLLGNDYHQFRLVGS